MNQSQLAIVRSALLKAGSIALSSPVRNRGGEGRRIGRGNGNALEFVDYRNYAAGDDLRRLDWRVYARSEQLMVKVFAEEIDPRCDLLLDGSASLGTVPGVAETALGIAALLAAAAKNAGFSLSVWHSQEQLKREEHPFSPLEWSCGEFDAPSSPDAALAGFAGSFYPRGLRIAVTDLLWPGSPSEFLSRFCAGASRTVLIVPGDSGDIGDDASGNRRLIDAESGEEREIVLDSDARRRYRERLSRHRELWERTAHEYGVMLLRPKFTGTPESWELGIFFQAGLFK